METYRTTRTVVLPSGTILALDRHQAEIRAHHLEPMDEWPLYRALDALTFKCGEIIGLVSPPAKGDNGLEPLEPFPAVEPPPGPEPAAAAESTAEPESPAEPAKPRRPRK